MFAIIADLIVRDALPADMPFIYDSWLNHYQANSYFAKKIKKQVFFQCHAILLNLIMGRPNTTIKIASDSDFTIFGYIVAENIKSNPVIHYLYVRPEFQKFGIGTSLVHSLSINQHFEVSHWTPTLNEIEKKFEYKFSYNPYKT